MSAFRSTLARLRNLFRSDVPDHDLHAELEAHLQLHVDDNLAKGMTPEQARRHALLKLGGVEQTKQAVHDQRSLPFFESLLQDTRYAARLLKNSPAFTCVAVITLGLAIGANTATFSVSNTYLRNPISFPEVDRVVAVLNQAPDQTSGWSSVTSADFLDWRARAHSFEAIGAFDWADLNLTGIGEPVKVQGYRVTANFFDVLRASPLVGRSFVNGEDQAGHAPVAILSTSFWRRQFAGDPAIIGKIVRLDGVPTQIVGVMQDNVRFPLAAEIWLPLIFSPQEQTQRTSHALLPIARLKPGVSMTQAQAEMRTIQDGLRSSYPQQETGWTVLLMPLGEFVAGPGRAYMFLLLGAVAFVLLIACTNVMNLLFARSTGRQAEYAIRVALGASRWRLVRQALIESVLLGMAAMLVGLLLGDWWSYLIRAAMPPDIARFIPGWDQVRLDRGVFLYTFLIALLAGIIAGFVPAFFSSSADPNNALKESGRGPGMSVSRTRLRNAFVVAEIALSLVLIVGASLMVKGLQSLLALNFKYDPQAVFVFRVSLPASRYPQPQQQNTFFENLAENLRHTSAGQTTAVAYQMPFAGWDTDSFRLEGRPLSPGEYQDAYINRVSPNFFDALHVPLIEGRAFTDHDAAGMVPVVIISESIATHFWPQGTAVGHRIRQGDDNSKEPWATIVGVSAEINYDPWRKDAPPAIYFPLRQRPVSTASVFVRSSLDPKALVPIIRTAVANADPDQPIFDAMTLDRMISNDLLGLSYIAVLMSAVGLMALVLSAVGASGVMAFAVAQRRQETGIRMALGARPQDVLRMFVFSGLKLLALGFAIGLPLAVVLARLISSLLYGVQSNDFLSFLASAMLLAVAVVLACYIPARRASRVDPIIALRYE
jgi:putative ABC transport system permease protein